MKWIVWLWDEVGWRWQLFLLRAQVRFTVWLARRGNKAAQERCRQAAWRLSKLNTELRRKE